MKTDTFNINGSPPPFCRDHRVNGRPVLAAAEAMERLAADTGRRFPGHDGTRMTDLRFDRFLFMDHPTPPAWFNRVTRTDDGSIRVTLTSRGKAPKARITRTFEHVSLTIQRKGPEAPLPHLDKFASLTGVCTRIDPKRIYRELVPFGPAYRNIRAPLLISTDGVMARVGSPQPADPRDDLCLGSPYPLDAAFHAACVWCQRFQGIVAFPVAIDRRTVLRPTRLDEAYTARVVPVNVGGNGSSIFDIYLYDDKGGLRETAIGVHMRDISGGRSQPPAGFHQPASPDPLAPFQAHVEGLVLLERDAVPPFAAGTLSPTEQRRLTPMTPGRARGYLSARLALKRLSRSLSGDHDHRSPRAVDTVADDGRAPQCPLADGTRCACAVSHDRRFTVAVAAGVPVGVDVEPLSAKPLVAMHLYMNTDEQALLDQATLDRSDAALRVWSAKEAAAKAMGINLAEAWARWRVIEVAPGYSRLEMDGNMEQTAIHATIDGHLFTLLTLECQP